MLIKISPVWRRRIKTLAKAIMFLLGLLILPHIYAAYFISTIDYGNIAKPIEAFVDVGNKLYVVAFLLYAFLARTVRELGFFNLLYFLVIYAVLMYLYLTIAF